MYTNKTIQLIIITITQEIDNIRQDIDMREFERQINILKF